MAGMLEIEDVHSYRGSSYVLQGVSMRIERGTCTTVLGRNGMGKTTLVRTLMGLTPPRSGRILFEGADLAGRAPHRIARRGIAIVPQGRLLFPSLTLEENLTLGARGTEAAGAWTLARVYELFPALAGRRKHRGDQLSGGEQQMAAIGRALLTNPRLILMDEPSEGLAPIVIARLQEIVAQLRDDGLSILLVEQNYRMGVALADHVYVLSKGHVVWEGPPAALEHADDVRHTHLGV
jgi:branched-chain amino acid transport system ATP-binding protein